jgi:mevalonate kinase
MNAKILMAIGVVFVGLLGLQIYLQHRDAENIMSSLDTIHSSVEGVTNAIKDSNIATNEIMSTINSNKNLLSIICANTSKLTNNVDGMTQCTHP